MQLRRISRATSAVRPDRTCACLCMKNAVDKQTNLRCSRVTNTCRYSLLLLLQHLFLPDMYFCFPTEQSRVGAAHLLALYWMQRNSLLYQNGAVFSQTPNRGDHGGESTQWRALPQRIPLFTPHFIHFLCLFKGTSIIIVRTKMSLH